MLRKTIASLFILIFALITIPTLFLRSVTSIYLDPKFYEGDFLDQTYSDTINYAGEEIAKDERVAEYFSKEEITSLIEENFTKENVKEVIKDFISQIKAIKEKRKTDAIKISLLPIKERISNMSGGIADKIVSTIPVCTEDQVLPQTQGQEIPECIPVEVDRTQIKNELKNQISKNLTDVFPGEFMLGSQTADTQLFEALNILQYVEMMLPVFMLIILLLIMLIVYKPYTLVMGFSGAAIFAGGLLSIAFVQILKYIPGMLNQGMTEEGEQMLQSAFVNITNSFVNVVSQKMTVYSLWLLGIGMVVILISVFLRKTRHNQTINDA